MAAIWPSLNVLKETLKETSLKLKSDKDSIQP